MRECSAAVASIPIAMTSGAPCVLTSSSFPDALHNGPHDLVCDSDSRWVHKTAHLLGDVRSSGLLLAETMVVVRGDITTVTFGEAVILCEGCVLRPPLRALLNRSVAESTPVTMGSTTVIGRRAVCEAHSVGSYVLVEDDCVIGEWVEIPDGVWLRSGSVVPPGMRLAPYVVYEGRPAHAVATVDAELHQISMEERVRDVFSLLSAPSS
ncbi:trimeric LpxA-like protein [Trypanosoma grayi]|uniref:trimeric LpxA-like protein n=1 Tax=Trypanosoma grayi TaxID=71804 RepID=UPI0004F47451|nr:trimeric LpxA-like protein [Trypanosoma grayi]KEG09697.1 trimeric LpxA-like protein [Trypanosoma grayi]